MLGLDPGSATLRRVKVPAVERDPLRVRRQFERAVGGAEWMPPGVGPAAVLLVRRLALGSGGGREGRALDQLVSQAMRELAARAHRPWRQGDAADAEAIVFADEAELIACLARDWLRGIVGQRWWWRSLLLDANVQQWLRREALPRPERLVAAIAMLATRSLSVAFVARLAPAECLAATAAVVRAFAVPPDAIAASPLPAETAARRAAEEAPPAAGRRPANGQGREAVRRLLREAPELAGAAIHFEQRRLLAWALVLTRAPAWARTASMARAVEALRDPPPAGSSGAQVAGATAMPRERAASQSMDLPVVQAEARPQANRQVTVPVPPVPGRAPGEPAGRRPRTMALPAGGAAPVEQVAAPAARVGTDSDPPAVEGHRLSALARAVPATPGERDAPVSVDAGPAARGEARGLPGRHQPALRSRIATRFGGLFYLLNAALALELYGDFTRPLSGRLDLCPWDWLALVGRAWFGDEIVADDAWRLLADLAGREEDEEPGRDFEAPSPGWLEAHLQELEARVALAVGEPEGEALRALVCRHAAGIEATEATVQVFLALDELPLAIRIAGLDRDPGWIPAAGRDVRFFFA